MVYAFGLEACGNSQDIGTLTDVERGRFKEISGNSWQKDESFIRIIY
jgi:hypothetical protein